METQLPPPLPRAGLSPQRTVLVCEPPTPSGPGCSAPSRVWRGLITGPGFSLRLLGSPPAHSPSPSGAAGLLPGRLLALGVHLGPPGGLGHSEVPWVGSPASSGAASQVCHEGVFWAPLEGWACQPSRQGGPWGGLWASGRGHGSGRWSVFLSGVGHAGSREADGSEGAGVGCGHEARAWVWGRRGPNWAGGVRRGWVERGGGTVWDVS